MTKHANDQKITLENGNTIIAYPSSLRATMIDSEDCKTEYEKINPQNNNSKYKLVKN